MPDAAVVRLRPAPPTRDEAESLAIEALAFIGADRDRTSRFLRASGLEPAGLRVAATTSPFLLGVLDHVAGDERLLTAFAFAVGLHPTAIMIAREQLAPRFAPAVVQQSTPSVVIQCDHCAGIELRRRRDVPHAPPAAIRLRIPRCGPCGGGFDQVETWLDAEGNEVGS